MRMTPLNYSNSSISSSQTSQSRLKGVFSPFLDIFGSKKSIFEGQNGPPYRETCPEALYRPRGHPKCLSRSHSGLITSQGIPPRVSGTHANTFRGVPHFLNPKNGQKWPFWAFWKTTWTFCRASLAKMAKKAIFSKK